MTRSFVVSATALLLFPAYALAAPGGPIREDVPWALHPGDDLDKTPLERAYGVDRADLPEVEPFWDGTLLYTEDSWAKDTLAQQGLDPLPAVAYDAAPGVLYIAMEGITLRPDCGNGDSANAAVGCSPLVDAETTFPEYGNASQRTALFNQLAGYYEPFNLVLTSSRPPDWLPYTMAVVGGGAGNAGQPNGVCGIANVACDGLKRNHVSLTFPTTCPGAAETAAQETAHNWGLEHTDNTTDLLYPFNNGGFKTFVDACMDISHATGDGVTQCDYIHDDYCPNGGGEQQNTYQELLAIFGSRTPDNQPPAITSVQPADGETFTSAETIEITASVSENSNFLAAKWSLSGGDTELSRCTNNVCDSDYNVGVGFDPNEVNWDFVTLTQPPPGEYVLTFEVLDAYGGYDSETITITVTEAEGSGGGSGDDSDSGTDPTGASDETGTDSGDVDSDGGASGGTASGPDDDGGDDDDDAGVIETDSVGGTGGGDDPSGCGCTTAPASPLGFLTLGLLGLTLRRRRRDG
ncbi:MAG: MYXO-CTERM sorting domain-containing protein [Myxococcota bacterium]